MKTLIANSEGKLAVAEVAGSHPIVLSSQALTAALLLTVAGYIVRKGKALTLAKSIGVAIADDAELHNVRQAQGLLAGVRIDAEKDRKEFTAPFLDSQRFIKEQFDLLVSPMVVEEKRLGVVMEAYAREIERKRQAQIEQQRRDAAEYQTELNRQQAEVERLEREAADAVRRQEEALAAQQAATTAKARAAADKLAAWATAAAEAAAEKVDDAVFSAELESQSAPTAPMPVAAVGKPVLDYELEHAGTRRETGDIYEFAAAHPQFCKIELRRSAILEELNNGGCFGAALGEIPKVPGLRIIETMRMSTRVVR